MREKSPKEGGIITPLVNNLLGGDKEKRIGDLVMSGFSFSTVLTMLSWSHDLIIYYLGLVRVVHLNRQCWQYLESLSHYLIISDIELFRLVRLNSVGDAESRSKRRPSSADKRGPISA